jgi:cell division septation protein DedD
VRAKYWLEDFDVEKPAKQAVVPLPEPPKGAVKEKPQGKATLPPSPVPTAQPTAAPSPQPSPRATPLPALTPVPKPTAPAAEQIISQALAKGWWIQAGAKESKEEAAAIAQLLGEHGFPVTMQEALVNNVHYHRVLVGPLESLAAAKAQKSKMLSPRLTEETPFIKEVR